MKFQEVTELVPGKKYKIIDRVHSKGTYVNGYTFKWVTSDTRFMKPIVTYTKQTIFLSPVFQKDKIQSDMEDRALNKLLQQIIGDSTFRW